MKGRDEARLIGNLQVGVRGGGARWRVGREEVDPFQGPPDGVMFLVRACLRSFRS
jgi:hypothetical protein